MDFLSSRNMTLVRNDSRKRRCCSLAIKTRRREARRSRAGRFPLPRAGSAPLHNHFHLAPPLSLTPSAFRRALSLASLLTLKPSPLPRIPPLLSAPLAERRGLASRAFPQHRPTNPPNSPPAFEGSFPRKTSLLLSRSRPLDRAQRATPPLPRVHQGKRRALVQVAWRANGAHSPSSRCERRD